MKLRKKIVLLGLAAIMLIQGPIVALATEPTEPTEYGINATNEYFDIEESEYPELVDDYEGEDELNGDGNETLGDLSELEDVDLEPDIMLPEEDAEDLEEEDLEQEEEEENITELKHSGVLVVDNVVVYSEPDGESINQLPANTNVLITGYDDSWYRIAYDGMTGWVDRSSVQQTRQTAIVINNNSQVRADDNADAVVLTEAETGTIVLIEQRSENWAQVDVDGQTGWINVNDLAIANGRRAAQILNDTNVHATPYASSTVNRNLAANQEVMVLQRTTNGNGANEGWTQVQFIDNDETFIGWILTDQVEMSEHTRRTTGDGDVTVKTGPGTSFAEGRRISIDTSVAVLAEVETWSHVRFTDNDVNQYGWIANSRLAIGIVDAQEIVMPSPTNEEMPAIETVPAIEAVPRAAITTELLRSGVTVINNANFRRGPGTNHGIIRSIPVNTNVRISGRQGTWYRVVHSGTTGWIARSSVQQTRQTAVVTGNNSPVRARRNTNANILTRAPRGTRVLVQQRSPNWAQVTVNGNLGWIHINNLRIANGRRPGRARAQVNLHSRPNESSSVVRRLEQNQQFMVVQRTTNGNAATQGWTRVLIRHNNGTDRGWIRTDQVELRVQTRRTTGTGTVPFRSGPGTNFNIERRINTNVQVTVLAEAGAWSRVRLTQNGVRHYGWIGNIRLTRISSVVPGGDRGQPAQNPTWGSTHGPAQLRRGAGSNYSVIRTIASDTMIHISRRSGGSGAWFNVTYGGQTGWIHEDQVRVRTDLSRTPINGGTINASTELRRGAGTGYSVIRTLSSGANVTTLSVSGTWIRVRIGNDEGWVREHFVDSTTPGITSITSPLRAGAGNSHNLLRNVPSGIDLTILRHHRNGWAHVRIDGQTGWMPAININIPQFAALPNVQNSISSETRTVNVTGETGVRIVVPRRRTLAAGRGFDAMQGVRAEHVAANGNVTRLPITWHQSSWTWRFTHNGRTFTVNFEGMLDNLTPGTYDRQIVVRRNNNVVARADQTTVVR